MQAEDFFTSIFSISFFVLVFSITFSSFFFTFTFFGVDWASGRCFAHVGHRSRQAEDLFFSLSLFLCFSFFVLVVTFTLFYFHFLGGKKGHQGEAGSTMMGTAAGRRMIYFSLSLVCVSFFSFSL